MHLYSGCDDVDVLCIKYENDRTVFECGKNMHYTENILLRSQIVSFYPATTKLRSRLSFGFLFFFFFFTCGKPISVDGQSVLAIDASALLIHIFYKQNCFFVLFFLYLSCTLIYIFLQWLAESARKKE